MKNFIFILILLFDILTSFFLKDGEFIDFYIIINMAFLCIIFIIYYLPKNKKIYIFILLSFICKLIFLLYFIYNDKVLLNFLFSDARGFDYWANLYNYGYKFHCLYSFILSRIYYFTGKNCFFYINTLLYQFIYISIYDY